MPDQINGGSPVIHPQLYQTVPTAVITEAQQRDRYLNRSEATELSTFFDSGLRRLEIAKTLTQHADKIIAAGANRIFVGGNSMAYLERPKDPLGLPGSGYYVGEDYLSATRKQRENSSRILPRSIDPTNNLAEWFKGLMAGGKPSLPSSFRAIDVSRYGVVRMKRSLRDLSWFLRYLTYAVVAGDTSILSVNTRGLRGVIPEDVTLATVVALREMQWKALTYFPSESAAASLVKRYFDVLIADYLIEKPSPQLRAGVSKHHPGLQLPRSYSDSVNPQPRWVIKPNLPDIEKDEVVRAAYRQVFGRDITPLYGETILEPASQLKSGLWSMKEFIRQLGKSRLYRQLYYEPYTLSRSIELACRHFLGRGLSCLEEFQNYFEVVTNQGFSALVDTFINSQEYADYFGEETVPYIRGLGLEAQECRNWGPQLDLFKYSAPVRKVCQFVTTFAGYQQPLPNQHPYGIGNDPLEIQFGAIFPQETRNPRMQPAHFSEDSRRILISNGAGNGYDDLSDLGRAPGSPQHHILRWESVDRPLKQRLNQTNGSPPSMNLTHHSHDAVIHAAYRQVFGHEIFDSQRQTAVEMQLKAGEITLREFIRQIAKSRLFREMSWEKLYVTKAIEYIHRRLLGRPTYGRREMAQFYDICAYEGFYALVDALIDSDEYVQVFGETIVPYERYITPRGFALRSPQGPVAWSKPRDNPPTVGEWMRSHSAPVLSMVSSAEVGVTTSGTNSHQQVPTLNDAQSAQPQTTELFQKNLAIHPNSGDTDAEKTVRQAISVAEPQPETTGQQESKSSGEQ